jgi:hypothetical protein
MVAELGNKVGDKFVYISASSCAISGCLAHSLQ